MNDFITKLWVSLGSLINPFDLFAVIFILSFSSVLFLSFVRKVPAKFSVIRLIMSMAVAIEGTVFGKQFCEESVPYRLEWIKNDALNLNFSLNINCLIIVIAAAAAGALIMTDVAELKYNILPVVSYQIFTVIIKTVVSELYYFLLELYNYSHEIENIFSLQFLNSYWYCCIALITVIVFLLLLPKASSTSRLKFKYVTINLVILIIYVIINYELGKKNGVSVTYILLYLILYLLISVVVFVLMCYLMKFASDQSNYAYIEVQQRSVMKSVDLHNERNEEVSKYLHDLPKHLDVIQSMALNKGADDLASYARTLTENYYKSRKKFTTGNTKLDELLNLKRTEAEKNNIEIIFSGVFPERVKIRTDDLRAVFSNAIDNAVNNCKGSKEHKKIRISSKPVDDMVIITVTSPRESAELRHGLLGSGSDFSRLRKRIIESTVRAYDGAMKWEIDDSTWKLIFSMKYK